MTAFQLLFPLTIFVGVLLTMSIGWWAWRTHKDAHKRQLVRRVGNLMRDERVHLLRTSDEEHRQRGWLGARLGRLMRSAGDTRPMRQVLIQMGLLATIGLFTTAWLLSGPSKIAGIGMGVLPIFVLLAHAHERSEKISRQLPDALDLITRTLRAGHALSDALRLAALELQVPISEEMAQVSEEHRLGIELRTCLENLLVRNPGNFDLRLFTSCILLQRETGGNLIEMLDHLAETIRERTVFLGKVEALTAEVKFSALILGALPFFVGGVILVMRPGYLVPLIATELGRMMLAGGMASLLIGFVVMRRLAMVEAAS